MNILKTFGIVIIVLLIYSPVLYSDDNFTDLTDHLGPFLISQSDIPDYVLHYQGLGAFQTGVTATTRTVSQIWYKNNLKNAVLDIEYGMFSTIPEAISGMGFVPYTFQGRYERGSLGGPIIGDMSWMATDSFYASVFFRRGNIGVQVMMPLTTKEDSIEFEDIISKIIGKIDRNWDTNMQTTLATARKSQIADATYSGIIEKIYPLFETDEYTPLYDSPEDTLWRLDGTQFIMGRRMQWITIYGTTLAVDICKCTSETDAKNIGNNAVKDFAGFLVNGSRVTDVDSVLLKQKEWNTYSYHKNVSLVSTYGNYVVFFYQYYSSDAMVDKISHLVNKTMECLSF